MLDEYLALGGVELGNNARSYAYASCLSCCAGVLKLDGCAGIHDATSTWTDATYEWVDRGSNPDSELPDGLDPNFWRVVEDPPGTFTLQESVLVTPAVSDEPDYDCTVIDRAPWYDPSNPFSQEFAGFYLLRVSGIEDGTLTATVTDGVDDGGVIGEGRYASRSVRVRSMLVGCGRAATSYGLAWLKAALGTSFCARHGDACGTSDLAFFIDCPPELDEGDADYAATTQPYRRYLHGVACTSAPIIAEEWETDSGAYVMVVEYILTAESPFVWGQMIRAGASASAVLTAFDDVPYNLLRQPSGEQADGVAAVIATQYALNGSAEYGATGWGVRNTGLSGVTGGTSTDVAAVGPTSYRGRMVATSGGTNGSLSVYHDIPLGSLPGGSRPSLSVWALSFAPFGPIETTNLRATIEWLNASNVIVGTTPVGTFPVFTGANLSAKNLTIPATAVTARVVVSIDVLSWSTGAELRLYADAIGLTVP